MSDLDVRSFQAPLASSKSVLILLPENPDLDSVAGALSLGLSLKEGGKEVSVACPSPMLVEYNRLVSVDKVTDNIDNRNLMISFRNYDASGIEKVSYNIENGKFTLVVVPKPGVIAPTKDQLEASFSGVSADLVIVVGAQNRQGLGKFAANEGLWQPATKVAIVGNIPAGGFIQAIELINPQASSVSEAVFWLIETLGLPVSADFATNLFAGLRSGTDSFQENITAETFAIASRLLRAGAIPEPSPTAQRPASFAVKTETPSQWLGQPRVFKGSTLP